ncbi:PilZ domain-containing protein [Gracilibacillus caseinilyticus]|uniref:PilZ domain-containing protein n=1 Tax=Gracilibacillus caseinilyticus TaxID=2932256 RepID=A0ABY4ET09_9BACI|nr:PilZ domain-containing protein [Gracilibacillus caseinilyticus]UOQ47560.1 PilZ domain-containing protein [Gracilibacillus caseinilyticus]
MVRIGSFIQLEEVKNKNKTYKCRVIDRKQDKLYIDYPIDVQTNRTQLFPVGSEFQALFTENYSLFSFPSQIIGKANINNIPTLIMNFDKEQLKKIQRREFVRVESLLDISVRSRNQEPSFVPFTSVTHDISGGGLSILIKNNLVINEGEMLDIMLVLPLDNEIEYLHLIGTAIRIHSICENNNILSVKFVEIDKKDQQHIIRYCFIKQLENRRKGFIQ